MKKMPNVRLFLRLLIDPGWAPIVVAGAFVALAGNEWADRYDYVFHGAGGIAIAYFFWRTASLVPWISSRVPSERRAVLAIGSALGVALMWEVAEFAADRRFGTTLQHGWPETLRDIAFGFGGAVLVVAVLSRRVVQV